MRDKGANACIRYHGDHVVYCPSCKDMILQKIGTRLFTAGIRKSLWKCIGCGAQFTCCSKRIKKGKQVILY